MAYTPDDLKDTYQVDPNDKDYTLVTVTDLNPGEDYKVQFAYIYADNRAVTEDDWSITKTITASTEAAPNPPKFTADNLSADAGILYVSWDGVDDTNATYKGVDRVEVFISGGDFDSTKPVTFFKVAGKKSIGAPAGTYGVTLKAVTLLGTYSDPSDEQTETVTGLGEVVEDPTAPNGFSSRRILAGIEVSWAGTYAAGDFKGFEAIKIYAGTSSSATSGTYTEVGVLTGNKVKNTIVVPVDGTYVVYGQATYIHAASVNTLGVVGTIQANVTSQSLGPGKATDADINDGAVVISKLASDVLTVGNLKAGDINSTSYIRAGTAGSARVEIASQNVSGTNVLGGLHIYSSVSGADPILSAPLTGGLTVTGEINATSGIIGNPGLGSYWAIDGYSLSGVGSPIISLAGGTIDLDSGTMIVSTGTIAVGDVYISANGSEFLMEDASGTKIIETTSDGRLMLGHEIEGSGRQVEVARSAQIAGSENANSGGLRNMYTIAAGNYYSTIYLSDRAANGDVLLVWET
jgi:hypothetical protein